MARVSIFLISIALIAGIVGCYGDGVSCTLAISSTAGGSVTIPGEGTFTYDEGKVVDLVAEPDEGYRFVDWTGYVRAIADVTAAATNITMNDSYSITANFALDICLEIWDWYDLDEVRNNVCGNHTLMNDLDSTTAGYEELASPTANQGKGWEPIGTSDDQFTGSFNGQGYEIRDLFINRPDEIHVGLFGEVGQEGVTKDIGVMNVNVIGDYYVGGLMGYNYKGTVKNSYSSGNVTGEDDVGGLVGYSRGTVSYSYSSGNVTGEDDVGGLVGYSRGTVRYSYSTGSVIGDYYAGGLVGYNYYGTVSNSYSSGNVTGDSYVGGLVGYNYDGTLINAYSTGRVSGNWNVGGLVAWSYYGNGSNSFWDRETSGQTKSAEGTGKTTAQMKSTTTFWGAGWNIIPVANPGTRKPLSIWNIVDDQTYPFLSWQT